MIYFLFKVCLFFFMFISFKIRRSFCKKNSFVNKNRCCILEESRDYVVYSLRICIGNEKSLRIFEFIK